MVDLDSYGCLAGGGQVTLLEHVVGRFFHNPTYTFRFLPTDSELSFILSVSPPSVVSTAVLDRLELSTLQLERAVYNTYHELVFFSLSFWHSTLIC